MCTLGLPTRGFSLFFIQILQSYFDNFDSYVGFCPSRAFLVIHPNKSRHSGNGIACLQAMPRAALGFCSANRAENLCYQFSYGQKILPQFRKIVGLVLSIGCPTHNYSLLIIKKATKQWLFSSILRVCSGWRQRFDS